MEKLQTKEPVILGDLLPEFMRQITKEHIDYIMELNMFKYGKW